jgi:RNA polymerase-interacting CarD/CdnL/TRCF family regulator
MAERWRAVTVSLLVLLVAPGCERSRALPDSVAPPAPVQGGERAAPRDGVTGAQAAAGTAGAASTPSGLAAMAAARKLIRTAQVTLEVDSWDATSARLTTLVESNGGYVADTQLTRGEGDRRRGTMTVRVPADRFAGVLAGVRGLGTVESETVSAQDVTKAYTDLETRLAVKRETADRLRQILKDRTAGLADVLSVERELARITEEIEQAEGERRYYDQQVALSTLTLTMHEPEPIVRRGAIAPLAEAVKDAAEVMSRSVAVLVYLTAFLLPWIVVGAIAWMLVRALMRRRRHEATTKPPLG